LKDLVRRQFQGLPEEKIQNAKVFSVETLPPKLNKNAIRKKVRFGPYIVPGSQVRAVGCLLKQI
jgi:hypothetical protein